MADDEDAVLSDVDEDPLPPPSSSSSSHKTSPPSQTQTQSQSHAHAQAQRLLDLAAKLDEERRLRRAAEDALANSKSRLSRLKAFAQDVLRKRDDLTTEAAASSHALATLQAEASTASSMLSFGFERISVKASLSSSAAPAPLPTSHKYSFGLPALAYGVLKRANDIVDDLLSQIDAASRDRDRARASRWTTATTR